MTCQRTIDEFLLKYFEGELSSDERILFESHLAICPPCEHYVQTYRQTVQLGKAVMASREEPLSANVPEEVVEAIVAASRRGK